MENKTTKNYYNIIAKEYTQKHGYGEHLSIQSLGKFASKLLPRAKVLDVGCGGGQDSKFLSDILPSIKIFSKQRILVS